MPSCHHNIELKRMERQNRQKKGLVIHSNYISLHHGMPPRCAAHVYLNMLFCCPTFSSFSYLLMFTSFFLVQLQVSPVLSERLRVFESLREKKKVEPSEKTLSIRLSDGRTVKGTAGVTTPLFVAQSIR